MNYVTDVQLREKLKQKMQSRKQTDVAREIGVPPQNLNVTLKGAPIGGRILAWLGYEKVDDLYRRKRT